MDDLISRQALINALLAEDYKEHQYCYPCKEVLLTIKDLPSSQPEIIHCRDCKYQEKFFHEDKRRKEGGYYIFGCELADGYSHVCLDDDFCSRAERKDE